MKDEEMLNEEEQEEIKQTRAILKKLQDIADNCETLEEMRNALAELINNK
ncbi:MAG: hypothetical protein IJV80_01330 [Clostridia bacterium]|nr:hypothetical protein [Clostridia bacterium]